MIYILLPTLFIVAACIMLLGIRIFFTKEGKFPDTHVGNNEALKRKGIRCMKSQDLEYKNKKNIFEISKETE